MVVLQAVGVAWDKQLLALVCESGKVAGLLLVDRSSFQLQLACRLRQCVHGQHEDRGSYHMERHLGEREHACGDGLPAAATGVTL